MVKPITIFVNYKNKNEMFNCCQDEFMDKAAEFFNIDKNNIVLFAKHKTDPNKISKIQPHDLFHLIKVEIKNLNEKDAKRISSHFTVQPKQMESFKTSVKNKLLKNGILTGSERSKLIELLDTHPDLSNKRKHCDTQPAVVANKKIQVDLYSKLTKDSCCQTNLGNSQDQLPEEDETLIMQMKTLAYNNSGDKKIIKKMMDKSFSSRRNFIMAKVPAVVLVRDKYPLLFSFEEIKNEIERIFYPGICAQFINRITECSTRIIEMLPKDDELYLRMIKSRERGLTEKQKTYATIVGSIFALPKILEEECRFIHLSDNAFDKPDIYPHISCTTFSLKDIFFDNVIFHIMVEERKVCEAPTMSEAILCLMAIYFIFNINYPENCHRTCTVFEKIFLRAIDTTDIDSITNQTIKWLESRG